MTNQELLNRYRTLGIVEATSGTITVGGKEFNRKNGFTKSFIDSKTGKYKVFQRSGFIKVYTGEGKDIADVIESDAELGKMYRIMKCIDRDNMILYSSHKSKKAIPANKELLIEMTNMSKDRGRKFISKMEKLGVIRKAKIGDAERYFVNPIYTMADVGISLTLYKLFREELILHLPEQAIQDLDMMVYIDLHPDVLATALEEEEAIKEQEDRKLEAEIENMAARSIAQEQAHKEEMASKEQSVKQENQRFVGLMKGLAQRIDGVYVGADDEVTIEIVEDVADAVLSYLASERTEKDKLMFMASGARNFISIDDGIDTEETFSFWNTENEKRLQTATVHNH